MSREIKYSDEMLSVRNKQREVLEQLAKAVREQKEEDDKHPSYVCSRALAKVKTVERRLKSIDSDLTIEIERIKADADKAISKAKRIAANQKKYLEDRKKEVNEEYEAVKSKKSAKLQNAEKAYEDAAAAYQRKWTDPQPLPSPFTQPVQTAEESSKEEEEPEMEVYTKDEQQPPSREYKPEEIKKKKTVPKRQVKIAEPLKEDVDSDEEERRLLKQRAIEEDRRMKEALSHKTEKKPKKVEKEESESEEETISRPGSGGFPPIITNTTKPKPRK